MGRVGWNETAMYEMAGSSSTSVNNNITLYTVNAGHCGASVSEYIMHGYAIIEQKWYM